MFFRIWKRVVSHLNNEYDLISDSPVGEKYETKQDTLNALTARAVNSFNKSKYTNKQTMCVTNENGRYVVYRRDGSKEIYYVP